MNAITKSFLSLALLGSAIAVTGCTQQIPPASVGVKFNARSGLSQRLIKPQVVWVGPYEKLIVYPTSIKNASYLRNPKEGEKEGDDSIKASTSEGALLPTDVTIAYHVLPEDVLKAFQNFGSEDLLSIQRGYIRWVTIYGVNVVSGQNSIFDLTSKERARFGGEVKKVISPILAGWGVTVDDVFIGEVYPDKDVEGKVQERIAARNDLELAKTALQKAKIDASTTLTNARREAETNHLLATQGATVLELKKLDLRRKAIAKWDGRPPLVGDTRIPFTNMQLSAP